MVQAVARWKKQIHRATLAAKGSFRRLRTVALRPDADARGGRFHSRPCCHQMTHYCRNRLTHVKCSVLQRDLVVLFLRQIRLQNERLCKSGSQRSWSHRIYSTHSFTRPRRVLGVVVARLPPLSLRHSPPLHSLLHSLSKTTLIDHVASQ
jgi:hypothetical protein